MDGRLTWQLAVLCSSLFTLITPSFAYEESTPGIPSEATTISIEPRYVSPTFSSPNPVLQPPQRMTLAYPDLFGVSLSRYEFNVELRPNGSLNGGNQRLSAYPSLKLTPQSSVGFSLKNFNPRFDIERAGFKTSLRLRGDGIKLNIRPADPNNRLEFNIKITDDESRLDVTYRY